MRNIVTGSVEMVNEIDRNRYYFSDDMKLYSTYT
jgi:hypothetical protein